MTIGVIKSLDAWYPTIKKQIPLTSDGDLDLSQLQTELGIPLHQACQVSVWVQNFNVLNQPEKRKVVSPYTNKRAFQIVPGFLLDSDLRYYLDWEDFIRIIVDN